MDPVAAMVRPDWPPLRHVRAGWDALDADERRIVEGRLAAIAPHMPRPAPEAREPLLHFFAFLAQVETIAIEVPLRFLPHCPDDVRPTLRRQLVDEVFHSTLFARIAHDLARPAACPPDPLPAAERMLERIRSEEDLGVTATMLNLVAEGWIETLFRHARRWGVADAVFQTVLEDEARHVHEATDYTTDLDTHRARGAVAFLEEGLIEVGAEPSVALAMVRLAGPDAYRRLVKDLHASHRRHLGAVGMKPGRPWVEAVASLETALEAQEQDGATVVADTPWMVMARTIWDTPRDPTMQGSFHVRVGHVPKRMLTPVFVAAVGRAWAKHPGLNRIITQGRVWQLPRVNVGVRVLVAPDELATVVITDADRRSPRDVGRMLEDGLRQLRAMQERRPAGSAPATAGPDLGSWAPPGEIHFSVGVSNVGKFGLEAGAGAFTGTLTPSTDLTIGRRTRKPVWRGVAYLPAWQVPVGALQDHRVFDGSTAGMAMQALQAELAPRSVRPLRKAEDTLPEQAASPAYDDAWFAALPPSLRMLPNVAISKYVPMALGGLGIGAGLGVGGYFLLQHLAGQAGGAAGGASSAAGKGAKNTGTEGARQASGPPAEGDGKGAGKTSPKGAAKGPSGTAAAGAAAGAAGAAAALDPGRCRAVKKDGSACRNRSMPGSDYCARHKP